MMVTQKKVRPSKAERPPWRILRESLRSSPTSSVTDFTSPPEYRALHRQSGSRKPVPPAVKIPKTRMDHLKNGHFSRSPDLQAAIERNLIRATTEGLGRLRKHADPKEIDQLFELFSKYDEILGHLAIKNQKLKSYVNGEILEDPGNINLSTVEILDTLEKLKLQRERQFGFGLGEGLDVSSNLRPLERSGRRSKSANPRFRAVSPAKSDAPRNPELLTSTRSGIINRLPPGREMKAQGEPSSSLERMKRTPPRFRNRRKELNNHSISDELLRKRKNIRHKSSHVPSPPSSPPAVASLSKSWNNVSRGSNYKFRHALPEGREVRKQSEPKEPPASRKSEAPGRSIFPLSDPLSDHEIMTYTTSRSRSSEDPPAPKPQLDDKTLLRGKTQARLSLPDSESEPSGRCRGRYGESGSGSERPPSIHHGDEESSRARERDLRIRERIANLLLPPFKNDQLKLNQSSDSGHESDPRWSKPDDKELSCSRPRSRPNRGESLGGTVSSQRLTALRSFPRTSVLGRKLANRQKYAPNLDEDPASDSSPTRAPRKNFLPISPTKRSNLNSGTSLGGSSYSVAPSEKARRLQSQVQKAYTSSQVLKESQERMQEDLLKIKDRYLQKSSDLEDRISQAMHIDIFTTGAADDPIWADDPDDPDEPDPAETRSFNVVEFHDGTLKLEDSMKWKLQDPMKFIPVGLGAPFSYHIRNGVIHLDDDDDDSLPSPTSPTSVMFTENHPLNSGIVIDTSLSRDPDAPLNGIIIERVVSNDPFDSPQQGDPRTFLGGYQKQDPDAIQVGGCSSETLVVHHSQDAVDKIPQQPYVKPTSGDVIDDGGTNRSADSAKPHGRFKKLPRLNLELPKRFSLKKQKNNVDEDAVQCESDASLGPEDDGKSGEADASIVDSDSHSNSESNTSLQNPMAIEESSSMIVQERRPKRLVRDLGIREVVLLRNNGGDVFQSNNGEDDKTRLREIPNSLLSVTDSVPSAADTISTHSSGKEEDHTETETDTEAGSTSRDELTDSERRSRRNSSDDKPVTVPDKKVRWDLNTEAMLQWNDNCGVVPCGF